MLWYAALLILSAIEDGRIEDARRELTLQERRLTGVPFDSLPARSAVVGMGLAYARLGDLERGARCESFIRQFPGDFHWVLARRVMGELALLRGDHETALSDSREAENRSREEGIEPELAWSLWLRARTLGNTAEAAVAEADAKALAERVGMSSLLGAIARAAPAPRAVRPYGLTARELEVLELVAQGCTNRDVGARLIISERTVVNHISHIFGKIGVENRAGATAFALTHGLVRRT